MKVFLGTESTVKPGHTLKLNTNVLTHLSSSADAAYFNDHIVVAGNEVRERLKINNVQSDTFFKSTFQKKYTAFGLTLSMCKIHCVTITGKVCFRFINWLILFSKSICRHYSDK